MYIQCRLSIPQDMCSMITDQTANLVSNQPLIYLKMYPLATCKHKYSVASYHTQSSCRVDYIMVNCLIGAVHKYIIKNICAQVEKGHRMSIKYQAKD
jgi:hypothetical protein